MCTILYRKPLQVSNCGGTFVQIFPQFLYVHVIFTKDALHFFYTKFQNVQMTINQGRSCFNWCCADMDECSSNVHGCVYPAEGGVCTNTHGTYSCSCASGYHGNGIYSWNNVGGVGGTGCSGKPVKLFSLTSV